MHALLMAKGFGPKMELRPSYASIIRDATSREVSQAPGGGAGKRRRNAVFEGHDTKAGRAA